MARAVLTTNSSPVAQHYRCYGMQLRGNLPAAGFPLVRHLGHFALSDGHYTGAIHDLYGSACRRLDRHFPPPRGAKQTAPAEELAAPLPPALRRGASCGQSAAVAVCQMEHPADADVRCRGCLRPCSLRPALWLSAPCVPAVCALRCGLSAGAPGRR